MERNLTTEELCDLLDVDRRTVTNWIGKGCPSEKVKNRRVFNAEEVAAWMTVNNLTGEGGRPTEANSEALLAAKLRKELAMAETYEVQLAKIKGVLVKASEVERQNVIKFTTIRNNLLGLGAALSPILVGLTAADIQTAIDERIAETLTTLSRA